MKERGSHNAGDRKSGSDQVKVPAEPVLSVTFRTRLRRIRLGRIAWFVPVNAVRVEVERKG